MDGLSGKSGAPQTAVCAVGFLASGVVGLAGGAGDQLAGFGVGLRGEGLDGDLVAEALEAADVAARAAPGAVALLVVAGAEVAVPGPGVGQEGVGDDELVSHDGALGVLFRHAGAQAAVLGAEEGLGAPG